MGKITIILLFAFLLVCSGCNTMETQADPSTEKTNTAETRTEIKLPQPKFESETSIEEAIKQRRSVRDYSEEALKLEDLSQLLWAAQGITSGIKRTAPSAGALYPLELYVVAGNVESIEAGVYHFIPETHSLEKIKEGDLRSELAVAAIGQTWIRKAPAAIVFTAVYERTTAKYGEQGIKYVHMEAGHAAENVYLQAQSLGVGTVTVGALSDSGIKLLLDMDEEPLYVMPVGYLSEKQ